SMVLPAILDHANTRENSTTSTPLIATEGVYELLVTDLENGCVAEASIEVLDDSDSPEVSIGTPVTLTCDLTEQVLMTINTNTGNTPTYTWTTIDGNIIANGDTPSPTIDQGGTYILTITNTENGCAGQDDVLVVVDQDNPTINVLPYDQLDCATSSLSIDAATSTGTNELEFVWTTANGNILNGNNDPQIEVNTAGQYQLVLNDIINGCADTLLSIVMQDTIAPLASIALPNQLDCVDESITLNAQTSSNGPNFQVDWTTTEGQFDNGTDGLSPTVSQPGMYQLIILNTQNNCADTAQAVVTQDDALPLIVFVPADTLNCAVNELVLNANDSSTGGEFIYNWTTTNGQIIAGVNTLMPTVNEPGDYTLTIENTANNCTNSALLMVAQDIVPPVANAGVDFELDCGIDLTNLDGTASSQGTIYTYEWIPLSGQMITNETSLSPLISETGSYQLSVFNTINACTSTDEITVTQDIPVANIDQVDPLCFGETGSISFSTVTGGQPPYLYSINGGQTYVPDNFFFNLPAGQYESLVEDSNGCVYNEVISVTQPDSVQIVILEPEIEINYGDSFLIQVQSNYAVEDLTFISWDNAASLNCSDCLEPLAQPTETSLFRLVVATEDGCSDEALLRVFVRRDFPVYIPNAFSPDGQGDNDIFYIFAQEGSIRQIRSFAIYDRWGEEMFYVQNAPPNDPRYGWDGTYRGRVVNSAVFVYYAEIEMADGRIEVFKGDIILMR
ncbi:MAG: gliding motility-associated C-terminal domain-containing protein, partial [Bacteroidota bacterium]